MWSRATVTTEQRWHFASKQARGERRPIPCGALMAGEIGHNFTVRPPMPGVCVDCSYMKCWWRSFNSSIMELEPAEIWGVSTTEYVLLDG